MLAAVLATLAALQAHPYRPCAHAPDQPGPPVPATAEARAAAYQQREARPWPVHADVRPYDVRHSFAVRVILETRDVFAARELMLHADIKTTLQYLDAAVTPSAAAAVREMTRRQRR